MTAENPDHLNTRRWLASTRKSLAPDARRPYRPTVEDFKLAWLLRDQFTRAELLSILEIATGKRYDNRKGIDTFVTMLARHINGMGDENEHER